MFAYDIKDWSKDIGRCISHCSFMSPTVFMYPIKTLHLVTKRYVLHGTYQLKEEFFPSRMWFFCPYKNSRLYKAASISGQLSDDINYQTRLHVLKHA